jgi:hypothetical protein
MTIVLKGFKELEKALDALPNKLFKQVIRRANVEVMKPVSKQAKIAALATGGEGQGKVSIEQAKALSKSIGRVTKVYAKSGVVVTVVGPRVFSQYPTKSGKPKGLNYLQIEFGSPEDEIQPQGYMRKTWDSLVSSVERNYADAVRVGLDKIVARSKK